MKYLIVDDERIISEGMAGSLRSVVGTDAIIYTVNDPYDALEIIQQQKIDIMFCDVNMPGMDGLELVQRIQKITEDIDVIFTTGYAHYSLDAWKTMAQAFILKPVGEDEIREVLDKIMRRRKAQTVIAAQSKAEIKSFEKQKEIKAMCFGNFELFYKDKPIRFTRKKSKEMMAYLIDRRGAAITTEQIRTILWEEDVDTEEKHGYVRVLANDIRKAFANIGVESILINEQNSYRVDISRISCDYYDFLEGDVHARRTFQEEYMSQYFWAESTLGRLLSLK